MPHLTCSLMNPANLGCFGPSRGFSLGHDVIRFVSSGPTTIPWYREAVISAIIAGRAVALFALSIIFGVLVALKIGHSNVWTAAAVSAGFLLFVILPIRLWRRGKE